MQRRNCESDSQIGHMKKKAKCGKILAVSCVVLGYGNLPCLWQAVFFWVCQVFFLGFANLSSFGYVKLYFLRCQVVFFWVCQAVF